MRTFIILFACVMFAFPAPLRSQRKDFAPASTAEIRIQRMVHDLVGKKVTLNLKEGEARTGTLVGCNGREFLIDIGELLETHSAPTVRSIILKPGVSEGLLVALSGLLLGGFGLGVSTLSFENASSAVHWASAAVLALVGGWIGYDTFYQETEIILP